MKINTLNDKFAVYSFDHDTQVLHIEDIYGGTCKLHKDDMLRFIEFIDVDILGRKIEGRQGKALPS